MKQQINISNYEQYAIDYIEGTLDESLLQAFESFLALNPGIFEEIQLLREVEPLQKPADITIDKSDLKIQIRPTERINADNYEIQFSAAADEALRSDEQRELDQFLGLNPRLNRDFKLYQKTVVTPDLKIQFADKRQLKKAIPLWVEIPNIAYRVAAAVAILLGGVTIWNVVNNPIYDPRKNGLDFVVLESVPELKEAKKIDSQSDGQPLLASNETITNSDVRVSNITPLPTKEARLIAPELKKPEERSAMAYSPTVQLWEETQVREQVMYASSERAQEMTLSQFVGKQFLGIDPEKTTTTSGLVKEGLIKAIDSREDLTLTASNDSDRKNTLDFLAGNFEFRRVNYK